LNLIENALDLDGKVIIIKFNSWRFADEDQLLINQSNNYPFMDEVIFHSLLLVLGVYVKKPDKWHQRKNRKFTLRIPAA